MALEGMVMHSLPRRDRKQLEGLAQFSCAAFVLEVVLGGSASRSPTNLSELAGLSLSFGVSDGAHWHCFGSLASSKVMRIEGEVQLLTLGDLLSTKSCTSLET